MSGPARVLVLVPGASVPDGRRARDAGLSAGLTLVHRAVPTAPAVAPSAADRVLGDVAFLEAGLAAAAEGFAAVLIDSFEDCGLAALRSRLSVPVVAPGKASLLYCLTLAGRFALVVPPGSVARGRAFARECGLERHCIFVEAVPSGKVGPDGAADAVAAAVRAGAEAVCLGDPSLREHAEAVRRTAAVPVVEPFAFAVAWTESLLALGLAHSRRAYPAPMVTKDDLLRDLVRHA